MAALRRITTSTAAWSSLRSPWNVVLRAFSRDPADGTRARELRQKVLEDGADHGADRVCVVWQWLLLLLLLKDVFHQLGCCAESPDISGVSPIRIPISGL